MNLNKKKSVLLGIISLFILVFLIINLRPSKTEEVTTEKPPKNISILNIGDQSPNNNTVKGIGSVKAETKVPVVSMQSATVRTINFNIGDKVVVGQKLATLSDNNIMTGLINAQTEYSNRKNNLEITKTSSEQNIESAEINLASAFESLQTSKIQLKNAQDNYDNGIIQIEKNTEDLKNNSIINYNNNLSIIFDTLNQIDYIIDVEEDRQIPGIKNVIAAKDTQSLNISKQSYANSKKCYKDLMAKIAIPENALQSTDESLACVQKTKTAIDDVITVLDNTVSSASFSQTTLDAQISKFNQLRLSILGVESKTRGLKQSIENIKINSKTTNDKLENALSAAKNQVNLIEIAYENAQLALQKAKSAKDQQILSAEIAVDSTRGQLNLANQRAGDLYITSPINGIITSKTIEIGERVNPGKMIAEISQLDLMKILVSFPPDEIYKININDKAIIDNKYTGYISQINPAANSQSKKVEVEIIFDNKNKDLIAESFVNVEIPTEQNVKSQNGFFLVPLKSVTITQNENYVYILKKDIALKQTIEIGDVQDDLIEIKSGLKEGDKLIVNGSRNLEDGDKVKVE